jgi:hypothetical protein
MPTKPKKVMSPYSIFSKLIAPIVKEVWLQNEFYNRFGIERSQDGMSYTAEMFKKIISPIAIYRALYLRLVEQKFYFTKCDANGDEFINYASFKKYMKEERGKKDFYNWFFDNYLDGVDKSQFKSNIINLERVIETIM